MNMDVIGMNLPTNVFTGVNYTTGREHQMSGLIQDHTPQTLENRTLQLAMEMMKLQLGSRNNSIPLYDDCLSSQTKSFAEEQAKRKSDSTTECVLVPSSEHVAEIVGRQGAKIKSLRAKTNTYIKTPVRGDEPVFVVSGRKDDVQAAKKEILSAVDHFTQIRASRRNALANIASSGLPGPPNPDAPGQIKILVRVPYQVVGLVVGPKGTTIKRIQQQTHTYIVTPSRDNKPIFEITGLAENVKKARQEIESHIALRTGSATDTEDDFYRNGIDCDIQEKNSTSSDNSTPCYTTFRNAWKASCLSKSWSEYNFTPINETKISDFGQVNGFRSLSITPPGDSLTGSAMSTGSSATDTNSTSHSPLPWHPIVRRRYSDPLSMISPFARSEMFTAGGPTLSSRAVLKNDCGDGLIAISYNSDAQLGGFVNSVSSVPKQAQCSVCFESDVVAALVPCGHNIFCMECATRIVEKTSDASDHTCPSCHQKPTGALRLLH